MRETAINEARVLRDQNAALRAELRRVRAENARLREESRRLRAAPADHVARAGPTSAYGPLELTAGTCTVPHQSQR